MVEIRRKMNRQDDKKEEEKTEKRSRGEGEI